MIRRLLILIVVLVFTQMSFAQDDDFGYELSVEGEKKIAKGLKLELSTSMRTQDDAERMDRYVVGTGLSYKFYSNPEKTLSIKANAGFDYLWTKKLKETEVKYFEADDDLVENGYFNEGDKKGWNVTDSYWRDRYRVNLGVQLNYSFNKRWSVSLKETFRYSHYCKATANRTKWRYDEYNSPLKDDGSIDWLFSEYTYDDNTYEGDDNVDENGNIIGKYKNTDKVTKGGKDRTILYSRLTVSYDIKGYPIDLFATVDYGCGQNYTINKWKFIGGYDYKINKHNKLTLFYRYNTESDDDEGGGHLIGLGYKFEF